METNYFNYAEALGLGYQYQKQSSSEFLHNGVETEISHMSSKELEEYYHKNPVKYYQLYVKASVSPAYNVYLAALGMCEESYELLEAIKEQNKEEFISEAGDLLFQIYNVANFLDIDMTTLKDTNKSNINIVKTLGELVGTILKKARYSDPSMFEKKYGMTLEERVQNKIREVLIALKELSTKFNLSIKDIMDYNLKKLDERHAEGKYYFGAGLGNTRSDGGSVGR